MKNHRWTKPRGSGKPVEMVHEDPRAEPADRGRSASPSPSRPARQPSDEQIQSVIKAAQAQVVRDPEEQIHWKSGNQGRRRRHQERLDREGVPCSCGDDRDPRPCLAHAAMTGRRRHIRP